MPVLEAIEATGVRMSLEQIRQTPAWKRASSRQRLFFETFVETNDLFFATQTAYQCKTKKNFQIQSYQVLESPKVQKLLNLFFGRTERDIFVAALEKRLKASLGDGRKLTQAEIHGIKTLFEARGWNQPSVPKTESEAPKPAHQVGQIVSQNDHTYRVTAVDADGHITAAEPVTETR